MFNTTIHESKVVAVTKEIEKTITPDKVTDMYDRVREEVERSIVRKMVLKGNEISVSAVLSRDPLTLTDRVIGSWTLNGEEHDFAASIDSISKNYDDDILKAVIDNITDDIRKKVVQVIVRKAPRFFS